MWPTSWKQQRCYQRNPTLLEGIVSCFSLRDVRKHKRASDLIRRQTFETWPECAPLNSLPLGVPGLCSVALILPRSALRRCAPPRLQGSLYQKVDTPPEKRTDWREKDAFAAFHNIEWNRAETRPKKAKCFNGAKQPDRFFSS